MVMLSNQLRGIGKELRPGTATLAWFTLWGYIVLLLVLR